MSELNQQRKPNPLWTAIVCGMASYVDAATIVSWGIVLVIYQKTFSLTPNQIGILSGLLTSGIAIGALSGGYLGDRFGRRTIFMATMITVIIGIVGLIFVQSYSTMVVFVVLVGLATGADLPVSLTLIAEASSSDKQRGTFLGLSQVLWLIGIAISAVFAMTIGNLGRSGAQIILAHIAIVAGLIILGRISIPESSAWKAEKAMQTESEQVEKKEKTSILQLLRMPYIIPFVALILFYGLSNAAYNVFGQFGSYILVNVAKVDVATASSTTLISLPIGVIGSLLFMKTVRSKRRLLYFLFGVIATAGGMLIPAIFGITYYNYIICMLIFSFAGAFAGEAIMKVWCQQSFPTMLRATAQGTVIAVGRFSAAGFAVVVPLIVAANPVLLFVIMSAMVLIGGFVAWVVYRTRDSQSEIRESEII